MRRRQAYAIKKEEKPLVIPEKTVETIIKKRVGRPPGRKNGNISGPQSKDSK